MAEESDISETVEVGEKDDCQLGDQNDQLFVLLLRVTQANGKPLLIGGFTGRAMAQMLHEIAGVISKEVVILTDQEVVTELEKEASMMEVSRAVHGCSTGGQSITVDSLVARKDLITETVRE